MGALLSTIIMLGVAAIILTTIVTALSDEKLRADDDFKPARRF